MTRRRVRILAASAFLSAAFFPPAPAGAQGDLYATGRIRLVEEFRTDDARLPDEAIFRNPLGVVVDDAGNAYVSDWTAHHVKVFGPDGAFRRVIGRPGQGPGDLNGPSVLAVSGDRLVIWESINQRFSIMKLDGAFVTTAPRVHGAWGELYSLSALPDGRFVAFVDTGFAEQQTGPLPSEQNFAVLLLSPELAVVKTLFEQSLRTRNWYRHPETGAVGGAPFPYHPVVEIDVSPAGLIAIGCSQSYEIGLYDPDKGRIFEIRRAYAPVKVEERDRKAHFDAFTLRVMAGNTMQTVKGAPSYIVKATEFPDYFPPYRGVCFDGRGYLWVQIYAADRASNLFDVFSPKGEFVNRVAVEGAPVDAVFASFGLKRFRGDRLWKIEKDADGFASLVKYRLMPGA